jgi:Ca-activated chloride channel family protein
MQVSGFVARTEVEQTFDNPFDRPLDAAYVFPLPTDAAVDEMEIAVGDRIVRGRIERRAEARRVFAEARARGVLAALLETQSAELFRQAVANVPPHTAVRVRFSFAAVLPYHDGAYHLTFPLIAAPRYTADGAGALDGPGVPPDERPAGGVDLEVAVDAGVPLGRVESPTHQIQVTRRGPRAATVALAAGDRMPNRDFSLTLGVAADAPRVAPLSTARQGEGTLSLLVHPRADTPNSDVAAREVVLLIDASSSMRGRPLAQARAVALQVLAHLRPADTFRLVAFADRARALDARALPRTPETLAAARTFLERIVPQGGTEVGRALDEVFSPPSDPARLRLVVLASDGLVGEERDVLARISAHLGTARLYGLGLGAAPNRYLLERATEAGRGEALYAALGDDPSEVATRLARRIDRPILTDLAIDWGGLAVRDVYPRVLPDLHADRPLVVHALYTLTDGTPAAGTVTLRGRIAGRSWSAAVPVTLPADSTEHRALGAVWARARVTDLETAAILRPTPELREQIAQTGLAFGLVTRETSFVAVDEGSQANSGGASFADTGGGAGSTSFASGAEGGGGSYGLAERSLDYHVGGRAEPAVLGRPFRLTVGALVAVSPAIADRGWSRVPAAGGFGAMAALGSGVCVDGRVFLGVAAPGSNEDAALALRTDHRLALCPHFGPLTLLLAAGPALGVDETGAHLGASGGTGVILRLGRFALRHEIDAAWLGAPSLSFSLGFGIAL